MAGFAGRFVEITYRASLLDVPSRPVLRFHGADRVLGERIGAAPVAGAGIWIGRVPRGAVRLSVEPTNRPGPFGFAIERIRRRWWLALVLAGLRWRPRQACSAVLARLIGWAPESDNNLAWATGATDLACYDRWLARRRRPLDPAGLDRPRHDASGDATVLLVVTGGADASAVRRTLASLSAQSNPRWEALLVDAAPGLPAPADARVGADDLAGALARIGAAAADVPVAVLAAGDTLPDYALAFLAEQRRRHPKAVVFYGDEVAAGRPCLRPGASPRLFAAGRGLGRALFAVGLGGWTAGERQAFFHAHTVPARLLDARLVPLRRVMLHTPRPDPPPPLFAVPVPPQQTARAAIIMPTRDNPALLARAVASVRAMSAPGSYRLVIVDNGSPHGAGRDLIDALAATPDVTVQRRAEPFNYSAFCNAAAAAARDAEVLVFLNDDTAVLSADWLQRLAGHALAAATGAVGARLSFPDGRLQHIGVVVGMGGSAGHFGASQPGDDAGWAGRNGAVHEVAAVTGACLAVARDKFEAVGGFDAAALPIELSDIDLCLKLNARGWQTVVDPAVHLLHEESASRGGATFRRLGLYAGQRDVFVARWRHVLRDDPTFHPGLSLYSSVAALG